MLKPQGHGFHLGSIFGRLEITSRRSLRQQMLDQTWHLRITVSPRSMLGMHILIDIASGPATGGLADAASPPSSNSKGAALSPT